MLVGNRCSKDSQTMAQGRDVVGPGTKDEANDINLCFCDTFFILFHFFVVPTKKKHPGLNGCGSKLCPSLL